MSTATSDDTPEKAEVSAVTSIDHDNTAMVPPEIKKKPVSVSNTASSTASNGLLHQYYSWKTAHQYIGCYSVEKLLALEEYHQVATPLRVFTVLVLTPLPGLLIIFLLAAIPLQNPLDGVSENPSYFGQAFLCFSVMTLSMMFFIRRALNFPHKLYSHRDCLVISLLTAGCNELWMLLVAVIWRFPIPYRDFLGIPSYTFFLTCMHLLVLGDRLRQHNAKVREYIPLIAAQSSTLFIFQALAVIYTNVPTAAQAVITVTFPVFRAMVKRMIWRYAHCLDDISTDVTLCVVEIYGSLFQNVCVQSARTVEIGVLIIIVDIMQALVEAKLYLEHKFVVDGRQAIRTAVKIIEGGLFPGVLNSSEKNGLSTIDPSEAVMGVSRRGSSIMISSQDGSQATSKKERSVVSNSRRTSKIVATSGEGLEPSLDAIDRDDQSKDPPEILNPRPRQQSIDDIKMSHREHATLLSQTLQLVFASEVLVFAEYAEFVSAIVYALYTLVLYHMPYAKYNLSFIGLSESAFWSSFTNTVVYGVLEGFTMFFLFALVRAKYGLSTLYQLAFVLEKYWMSVQGKMVGSLVLIFIINTVHHGMDVSLQFDWEKVLEGSPGK